MEKIQPDKLVDDSLVEEVIRELKRRLSLEGKRTDALVPGQALILGKLTADEEQAVSALYTPVEFRSKNAPDYEILISAHLSIEAMACLALGMPGNEEAACILYSLLQGKKVYILERGLEYRSYRDKAHKTLYRLFQEYENRIAGFGVRFIGNILDIRRQEEAGSSQLTGKNMESEVRNMVSRGEYPKREGSTNIFQEDFLNLSGRKLLRESDFSGVSDRAKSRVLIDRDAIVTPLAMDYITNHRLEIRRK